MTDEREETKQAMLEASTGSQGAAAKIVADTWLGPRGVTHTRRASANFAYRIAMSRKPRDIIELTL